MAGESKRGLTFGNVTPEGLFPNTFNSDRFGSVAFGVDFDGWVFSSRLGFVRTSFTGDGFFWINNLETFASFNETGVLNTLNFGALAPTNDPLVFNSPLFGEVSILGGGFIDSSRYGPLGAGAGSDGVWFWSPTGGWLGRVPGNNNLFSAELGEFVPDLMSFAR